MESHQFSKKETIFFLTLTSSTVLALVFGLAWIITVIIEKEIRLLYYLMLTFSIISVCVEAFGVILLIYLVTCVFIHEHKCKKAEHKEKGKEQ